MNSLSDGGHGSPAVPFEIRPPELRENGSDHVGLFHAGAFILVNAYLWLQDIALDSGLDYAYQTTIAWGIGLAFHGWHALKERDAEQLAEREEPRELQHH